MDDLFRIFISLVRLAGRLNNEGHREALVIMLAIFVLILVLAIIAISVRMRQEEDLQRIIDRKRQEAVTIMHLLPDAKHQRWRLRKFGSI